MFFRYGHLDRENEEAERAKLDGLLSEKKNRKLILSNDLKKEEREV